jgi:hypothetical protein
MMNSYMSAMFNVYFTFPNQLHLHKVVFPWYVRNHLGNETFMTPSIWYRALVVGTVLEQYSSPITFSRTMRTTYISI